MKFLIFFALLLFSVKGFSQRHEDVGKSEVQRASERGDYAISEVRTFSRGKIIGYTMSKAYPESIAREDLKGLELGTSCFRKVKDGRTKVGIVHLGKKGEAPGWRTQEVYREGDVEAVCREAQNLYHQQYFQLPEMGWGPWHTNNC